MYMYVHRVSSSGGGNPSTKMLDIIALVQHQTYDIIIITIEQHQTLTYRIVGIFRGYKCSRFSRIEPVPRKFIPTKFYILLVLLTTPIDNKRKEKGI